MSCLDLSGFNNLLRFRDWLGFKNWLRFGHDLRCFFNDHSGGFGSGYRCNDWLNGFCSDVLLFNLLLLRTGNRVADPDFAGRHFW
ncbi:hypothetical protein D3C71_2078600 [compost metagenome]